MEVPINAIYAGLIISVITEIYKWITFKFGITQGKKFFMLLVFVLCFLFSVIFTAMQTGPFWAEFGKSIIASLSICTAWYIWIMKSVPNLHVAKKK